MRNFSLTLLLTWTLWSSGPLAAQDFLDDQPINYASKPVHDPVARLMQQVESGEAKLEYNEESGYLESLLEKLQVPTSSQMLVFSKTSFQQRIISPRNPRALYFNDEVYVGWVPGGPALEITAVDPQQGAIFYLLKQEEAAQPKFTRDNGSCLVCHASSRTHGVPGHLVRSVYPSSSGMPNFGAGTFTINHASPLKQRWGGWYVTGTHGNQRHLGNALARDQNQPESLDIEAGANVTDLSQLTQIDRYPTKHSDIVALMVLEHQTEMHNLITCASYETRRAMYQNGIMNKALERGKDYISESTERRITNSAENLLKYLLFVEEAPLTDKVAGTSGYAEEFAKAGLRDKQGRSLRDFDLQTRMFKYPCSYLIDSAAFQALPAEVKEQVYRRLWEVLTGKDQSETFARLSPADRQAILEILRDTHTGLPDYWTATAAE